MIAAALGGYTDLVQEFGVAVTEVDLRSRTVRRLVRTGVRLRRLLREFDPEIVHTHTITATLVARVAVTGRRARVVATVHNEYQRGVILMSAAHRVVGVSVAVSAAMRRRGVPGRKVRTVLNGVVGSVRRQVQHPAPTVDLAEPAVVSVGAVSHRKGADVLVKAATELAVSHGAHTYFAGNIDWEEPRQAAERSAGSENVHFLGFSPDPRPLLSAATVFVLASRRDPAPLVLVEAMEAGLPIVACAVDGVPELLGDGAAGLLVAPDDPAALVEGIRRLLDDEGERRRLGEAARHRSVQFGVSRVSADYRDVYADVLRLGGVLGEPSARPSVRLSR
jgi:glycosyltransferase involved in cell wall biosynthesis